MPFEEIVVVSNAPEEFGEREDRRLAVELEKYAPSRFQLLKGLSPENMSPTSAYLFRCIYDESIGNVVKDMAPIYEYLHQNKVPYLTVYNGKGDQRGKSYLAKLYKEGFQVVPTFLTATEALGFDAKEYLVKPFVGGTGIGVQTFSREELADASIGKAFVIQPRIKIAYETSYLYIDNAFQYALKTGESRWDLVVYEPSADELAFGEKCIAWNPIKGIQRVDCAWTTGGKQYLLELEDWCPFLSLFDSADTPKDAFIENLVKSLKNFDYKELQIV